jgi:hypothetical protein
MIADDGNVHMVRGAVYAIAFIVVFGVLFYGLAVLARMMQP